MVQDVIDCNGLLAHVQNTSSYGLFYRYECFDFDDCVILSLTDASHAADFDQSASGARLGHRSQSGRMLCLAARDFMSTKHGCVHPVGYRSNVVRRVPQHSTSRNPLNGSRL